MLSVNRAQIALRQYSIAVTAVKNTLGGGREEGVYLFIRSTPPPLISDTLPWLCFGVQSFGVQSFGGV